MITRAPTKELLPMELTSKLMLTVLPSKEAVTLRNPLSKCLSEHYDSRFKQSDLTLMEFIDS